MRTFKTSGQLQRMFLAVDNKTIIRRPNCRKFCLDNDIYMEIHEKAWLIDYKDFMQKINPKKITAHYKQPKIRNLSECVLIWNKKYRNKGHIIDKHMVERFLKSKKVFHFHHGNRWFLNYDQLEVEIAKFIEAKKYKKRRIIKRVSK